ncbi:hypothetical protein Q5752_005631 [Cryptotrichosporon argae]
MAAVTPPRADDAYAYPQTPEPMRARMQNLQRQVDELVRKSHAAERKHRADLGSLEQTVQREREAAVVASERAEDERARADALRRDVERCRAEGEGMRDELNLYSAVQQNKALLALAQEQMQMLELEHRLVVAEAARVMRDHKLALFQAREDEQAADLAERDAHIVELETELGRANTSLSHRRAAETKAAAEATAHEGAADEAARKVARLEATVKSLREKEKEARDELEQRGSTESTNALEAALRTARAELKAAKAEIKAKTDQLADAADELAAARASAKEREKALKARLREAEAEKDRLAGVEDEVAALRDKQSQRPTADVEARPSPKRAAKARNATPESDEDESEDDVPKKKRAYEPRSQPLADTDADNKKKAAKRKSPEPEPAKKTKASKPAAAPEPAREPAKSKDKEKERDKEAEAPKKKTRKLLNAAPAFTWDPIMNSGDGVIPAFLSPVKPAGKSAGTIPRAGFASLAARRF